MVDLTLPPDCEVLAYGWWFGVFILRLLRREPKKNSEQHIVLSLKRSVGESTGEGGSEIQLDDFSL